MVSGISGKIHLEIGISAFPRSFYVSTTTKCQLLLSMRVGGASAGTDSNSLRSPVTHKLPDEGAEEDHDDDIAVEVCQCQW
jgi:hypothetical protein